MLSVMGFLNDIIIGIGDATLGWSLRWPQEFGLVLVAVLTAALLAFVRLVTTNQDHLRRCRDDKRTLKRLMKEAKKRKDKDAVRRHRATLGMIGMESMKAEGMPLLVSLIPIIILATWAFTRLAYVPPQPGEPVEVRAYFPVLSIGEVAHVVPQDGLESDHWLTRVAEDKDASGAVVGGVAEWQITAAADEQAYKLPIRCGTESVAKELHVDGRRYSTPIENYGDNGIIAAQVVLSEFRPFGLGGLDVIYIAPWMLGYLAVAIPFALVLRRAFGIL